MPDLIPFPSGGQDGPHGAQGRRLYLHRESGEHMSPTLNDGDLAVWTPWQGEPLHDALYLVQFGDDPRARMVKHVQVLPHRRLLVISANRCYAPVEVVTEPWADGFTIVGRVVGLVLPV